MNAKQTSFMNALIAKFGGQHVHKSKILDVAKSVGISYPAFFFTPEYRVGRSMYSVPTEKYPTTDVPQDTFVDTQASVAALSPNVLVKNMNVETDGFTENLVPSKDPLFVPFNQFGDLKQIISSKMFYPIFITGLSGNGKTFSVEQACAQANRSVIRVNFTRETDEDDLIGGFRLVNGETKFFKGPVIKAMEMGAVLLLDEIDLGSDKIMCLQSIIEGKGYFVKKTGEFIKPKHGFNIVATANTKGKGSMDGRFIGTNIMNEAFLERFPITVEQVYPSVSIEKKILGKLFDSLQIQDEEFVTMLCNWAEIIRSTFNDGGVDEVISTRRLVHIGKAYSIFKDRNKAIEMCINRFDEDTKQSFHDLYTKIDPKAQSENENVGDNDISM